MTGSTVIPLNLSPARLDEFCDQLQRRNPDPALLLQLLTTVAALLGNSVADPGHPTWLEARRRLDARLDAARQALLDEHAGRLGAALQAGDGAAVGRSFTRLSRSGFADAAARTWAQLSATERERALAWLRDWLADARERITHAGRYPDAPDFLGAEIALDVYLGLQELHAVVVRHAQDAT